MKTKYIILVSICIIFAVMWMIGIYFMGITPMAILGVPLAMYQLIFLEGNGIVCFDACGPCSNFGYQYILVKDKCVLPSEESCKLLGTPGDWKFVEWTCQPVCKVPYTDSCKQEMIMETIQNKIKLKRILDRCEYQEMMDKRNWIGLDGIEITNHQPLYVPWKNSTHYIDNNVCEFTEIK